MGTGAFAGIKRASWRTILLGVLLASLTAGNASAEDTPPPPAQAAAAQAFTPTKITVRTTQLFVRRNEAWGKKDLYVLGEAIADGVAKPQFLLKMPNMSDNQLQPTGMNGQGTDLFTYDAPAENGAKPPRKVHLRVRVFKSGEAFRKAAQMLEETAKTLGKAVPGLAIAGPEAVVAAAVAQLGAGVVSNALAVVGSDELIYEWQADLAANAKGELGQANDFPWCSDRFGKESVTKEGITLPAVRLDGTLKVE